MRSGRTSRRKGLRGRLPALLFASLTLPLIGFVLSSLGTGFEAYSLASIDPDNAPPAWTAPCQREQDGRGYVLPCARVTGRVLYEQPVDPDGDGDVHVVTVTPGRVVIVKFTGAPAGSIDVGFGDRITVAGQILEGASGLPEVVVRGS